MRPQFEIGSFIYHGDNCNLCIPYVKSRNVYYQCPNAVALDGLYPTTEVRGFYADRIIKGKRPVTAELALLFGKTFEQSPEYWLNLQSAYDLKTTVALIGERLRSVQRFAPA